MYENNPQEDTPGPRFDRLPDSEELVPSQSNCCDRCSEGKIEKHQHHAIGIKINRSKLDHRMYENNPQEDTLGPRFERLPNSEEHKPDCLPCCFNFTFKLGYVVFKCSFWTFLHKTCTVSQKGGCLLATTARISCDDWKMANHCLRWSPFLGQRSALSARRTQPRVLLLNGQRKNLAAKNRNMIHIWAPNKIKPTNTKSSLRRQTPKAVCEIGRVQCKSTQDVLRTTFCSLMQRARTSEFERRSSAQVLANSTWLTRALSLPPSVLAVSWGSKYPFQRPARELNKTQNFHRRIC